MIQLAFGVQLFWKPYINNDLNQLERLSLTSALAITVSGLYYMLYADSDSVDRSNVTRVYLLNTFFMVISIWLFLRKWISFYYMLYRSVLLSSKVWERFEWLWMLIFPCCCDCNDDYSEGVVIVKDNTGHTTPEALYSSVNTRHIGEIEKDINNALFRLQETLERQPSLA